MQLSPHGSQSGSLLGATTLASTRHKQALFPVLGAGDSCKCGTADLTSSYPVRHSPGLPANRRVSRILTTADEGTGGGPGLVRLVPASTIRLAHRRSAILAIWRVHAVHLTPLDVRCEAAVLVGIAPGWSTDSDRDRPSLVRIGWLDSRTPSFYRDGSKRRSVPWHRTRMGSGYDAT